LAEETSFEIDHFHTFQTCMTLTLTLGHTVDCCVALIDLCLHTKFRSNR